MTTRRFLAVGAILAVAVAAAIRGRRDPMDEPPSPNAKRDTVQSAVLGERRELLVYLPQAYQSDTTRRYPVVYVLDGALQANHIAESAARLARTGAMPPIIVVGVSNLGGASRDRDLTPPNRWRDSARASQSSGARRFLSFLETELIRQVESDYRTSRPRALAGWSRGGLFVLYSQIASPSLFDARLALGPFVWGDEDDQAVGHLEEGLSVVGSDSLFLYLSLGDDETQTMPAFRRVVRLLETRAPTTLRWKADITPGAGHDSNPRLSAPVALCAVFARSSTEACR